MAKKKKPLPIPSVVLISDPNANVDDLLSFVFASYLVDEKKINLKGIIATNGSQTTRFRRAKFTKGALVELGLPFVKVMHGVDYEGDDNNNGANFYAQTPEAEMLEAKGSVIDNRSLLFLQTLLKTAEDKEIIIVINAQMNDLVAFINNIAVKNLKKIKKIIVMGNCLEQQNEDGLFLPDPTSFNNYVSINAANEVYKHIQINKIPLVFTPNECAYKININNSFFDEIKNFKHPLSKVICSNNKAFIEHLYNNIKNNKENHLNINKFSILFTGNEQTIKGDENFDEIYPKLTQFNLYDVISVLAAVDSEFKQFGNFTRIVEDKAVFRANIEDVDGLTQYIKNAIITKLKGKKIDLSCLLKSKISD